MEFVIRACLHFGFTSEKWGAKDSAEAIFEQQTPRYGAGKWQSQVLLIPIL
ncbi:hypothetical protein [Rufibacter ruber]|uniref:hypothetical protein n=1 Tax=Rufibacter ruber TaxID=1783499 RepID=UPI000A92271E|nr:hypothetical protein [Rufibacter ruber]